MIDRENALLPTFSLLLVVFLSAPTLRAREADGPAPFAGRTLAAYLQRTFEANADLKAFDQRYRAATQRTAQAGALPDPRIQITHFVESIQTRTGTQENVLMINQTFPWFGKLGRREMAASAEAEALWYMVQERHLMLAREVAVSFFEYGYTGKAIELTKQNLGLLRRLEPIVEERVRGGGDLNPLLRLQVEAGRMNDRLQTMMQDREAQSARIAAVLVVSTPKALPWPEWEAPASVALSAAALRKALEENNPSLAVLDRKVASAEARRALARFESYPELNLGVNYIQLDRYAGSTMPDAGRDPWGVTLGVNIPIWTGRNRAVRAEAASAQAALEHERRDREYRLKADLMANLARHDDANRRLKLFGEELLGLAQQALEITQSSYEAGRASVLEVIDSERSLLELHLQYWRAAADGWQARVNIQTLTNQPIAGVMPPNNDR